MYNLVIIDDEESIVKGLKEHVSWLKIGFQVVATFSSSQAALLYCETKPVDVILTDIRMPFISGLDFIALLQEKLQNPPLFCIMSAYDDFSYAQKAIKLGVKSYPQVSQKI